MTKKQSYTVPEIGNRHGISHVTVYKEINSGNLRSFKVGNCRRVSGEAERDWVKSREEAAA